MGRAGYRQRLDARDHEELARIRYGNLRRLSHGGPDTAQWVAVKLTLSWRPDGGASLLSWLQTWGPKVVARVQRQEAANGRLLAQARRLRSADCVWTDPDVGLVRDVRRALLQLTPKDRTTARLYWIEDWTMQDIGDLLGVTRQAIDLRLSVLQLRLCTLLHHWRSAE